MKILKANGGVLTNFEMLQFFKSRGVLEDPNRLLAKLKPSEYKVYDYLADSPACNQTKEHINEFIEKSKEFDLAKADIVNIINNVPTWAAELVPLIEKSGDRMGEERLDELMEIVSQVLPRKPKQQNLAEGATVDDSAQVTDEEKNVEEEMNES